MSDATAVRRVPGPELLGHVEGVRQVYAEAFGATPWSQDEGAAGRFAARLAADVIRPGFVAALALDGGVVLGFATAWTTPAAFPADHCYPQVTASLGAERTAAWLCGAREVDELAVLGAARGRSVGAALLDTVTADAPGGRCWLLTSVRAELLRFSRRGRWVDGQSCGDEAGPELDPAQLAAELAVGVVGGGESGVGHCSAHE
ncbi:GNAT family N-acetyltransferase [Streptomyces sp. NBC_01020]|uniref:GNAT family N-acetyltransferase n=1 Tax=unclassified Streptomyces TaxID=2593676 RepID=UPI002E1FE129|nr:GNAT family N-acetyltransferase [Streptomyces sp. NBC_01020]WSX71839.1 GNAT family N-acetyltransferase [Streptomyces sp. NBC_00932]